MNSLLLLRLVGCLYYCISDVRSHKNQIEDGRNYRLKHVELIVIINIIQLLLHLVGCLYYCISDARSHKHQIEDGRNYRLKHVELTVIINIICYCCVQLAVYIIVSVTYGHTIIKLQNLYIRTDFRQLRINSSTVRNKNIVPVKQVPTLLVTKLFFLA